MTSGGLKLLIIVEESLPGAITGRTGKKSWFFNRLCHFILFKLKMVGLLMQMVYY